MLRALAAAARVMNCCRSHTTFDDPEERELFRHDVVVARYSTVWHIDSNCSHLRHADVEMFRPCRPCIRWKGLASVCPFFSNGSCLPNNYASA